MKVTNNTPALAIYRSITKYEPKYADLIIRCTWFRTYFGLVNSYNVDKTVSIVMEGTPLLLFTLNQDEIEKAELLFKIDDIRNKRKGVWSACQQIDGQAVWYI